MNNVSLFKQTHVYFKKITRIAIREKAWKFILFAAIIAAIVAAVTSKSMFANYESTKSGFFTLASACIWLGIFNSIQSICKEHDIIRSEYRQGMKMTAYVCANIYFQALLCLIQAIIVYVICILFGFFAKCSPDGAMLPAIIEYFITIYLMIFGAAVLGLMVSAISSNPTTAMTIMPFVLILQLIMCGVLFDLNGISEYVAYITFSKWGMSALGCTADLNLMPHVMAQKFPDFAGTINNSYPMDPSYFKDAGTLLIAWAWTLGITFVSAVVSIIFLKIKNRDS